MSTALTELSSKLSSDPDAQATVTDFLDYTEFFPSDLSRSLTLIGKLDASYQQDVTQLHELTKTYGTLPTLPTVDRPQPQTLRKEISAVLDHAIRCRELAVAETNRLHNLTEYLHGRLGTIKKKLKSLPKPPSREPTPVPAAQSPTNNRSRKIDNERVPRNLPFMEGHLHASTSRTHGHGGPSHRSRRVIIPGEVLPPYDPNSPELSATSDSESERVSSPGPGGAARTQEKSLAEKVIRIPKSTTIRILKQPLRARLPGIMGTNVHSTVAGISVSNAMAILAPPPPDPKPGSKHAPWLKLTEWELNKLRKRMKKNADWVPSDTMVRRELAENKRGLENFLKAQADAEAAGEELLDEEPEAFIRPVTYRGQQPELIVDASTIESLENRGMKLNQAKKLKRNILRQEMATREHHPSESTERSTTETSFDTISVKPEHANFTASLDGMLIEPSIEPRPIDKKRKREPSADPMIPLIDPALLAVDEEATKPHPKKIKLVPPTPTTTDSHKLTASVISVVEPAIISVNASTPEKGAQAGTTKQNQTAVAPSRNESSSPPKSVAPTDLKPPKAATRSNKSSAPTTKAQTPALEPPPVPEPNAVPATRPRSRGSAILSLTFANKKAASAEPPARRVSGRRASNASLPSTQANTPAKPKLPQPPLPRRDKRPAPGVLTSHDNNEGGLQVILGKRKVAPGLRKKSISLITSTKKNQQRVGGGSSTAPATPAETVEEEEPVDPNEPRYCICGGVSWGQMVACENRACENEWFHFDCVGLSEMPGRRTKWYCPDCRKKLGVREHGEPIGRASTSRK